jgi:hypothetical protein
VAAVERVGDAYTVWLNGAPRVVSGEPGPIAIGGDPARLAFVEDAPGGGRHVVFDSAGPPFAQVHDLAVTGDGRSVLYTATRLNGAGAVLVYNHEIIAEADPGHGIAIVAVAGARYPAAYQRRRTDAREGDVGAVAGAGYAATYQRAGQWCLNVNGKEMPIAASPSDVLFSPDGTRWAAIVVARGEGATVLSDLGERHHRFAKDLTFCPAGRRFAYWAREDGGTCLVVDGAMSPVVPDAWPVIGPHPQGKRM